MHHVGVAILCSEVKQGESVSAAGIKGTNCSLLYHLDDTQTNLFACDSTPVFVCGIDTGKNSTDEKIYSDLLYMREK